MKRWLQIYLVPGAVLQSVMVGGGYGTGREVVEFFTRFGLLGGLAGITIATLCIARWRTNRFISVPHPRRKATW